jgi:hypothetical protein
MISNYKQRKDKVLKIYEDYIKLKSEIGDNNKIESMARMASNIKEDKFVLMVVGEAKSGKSTFINAFLGKEILPMDVKQCTSAIIELSFSSDFELKAEYANGEKRFIRKESEIVKFLKEHAAINDKFREIPVTTINNELLIKSKGDVKEYDIKNLILGVKNDNTYNLEASKYEQLIREYINTEKNNWGKIVTKIKIGYPFSEEMKGITIIDSPGVNALGKVGDITEKYIENANAIIFIKSLNGQALESASFKSFFNSKCVDKHKETLFLILTGSANQTKEEEYNLRKQAVEMYRNISEEKIVCVDSKLQLYYNRCKERTAEEIDAYFKEQRDKLESFAPAAECWLWTKEKNKFEEEIKEKSNFLKINDILERFARKAQYLALIELLSLITKGYVTMRENLKEKISLNKISLEDPNKLTLELNKKIEEISTLQNKINVGIENVIKKYTDHEGGVIKKEAERVINNFKNELANLNHDIDELEKVSFHRINDFERFRDDLGEKLVKECDQELLKLTQNTSIPSPLFEPSLSKEDFENIKKDTESEAKKNESYTTGWGCFRESKTRSVYSREKHFHIIKDSIVRRIEEIKSKSIGSLQDYTIEVTKIYKAELNANANKKQDEYSELLKRKATAEQLLMEIKKSEESLKNVQCFLKEAEEMKGGIEYAIG